MHKILPFLFFLISNYANAAIEVGAGTTSYTSGRLVPSLDITYSQSDWAVELVSTGVRSGYYYQSSYLLAYYKTWKAGQLWGGDMDAGFGPGLGYSIRSFQDDGGAAAESASDFVLGPSLRMNWSYGRFYTNMSATWGLRSFVNLSFVFQDIVCLSLGWRFL